MPIITAIRNACEKVVHYSNSYFFHAYHKQWTAKILHVMGEYNSQKLTPKLKKLADDYSVEVFGRTSRPNVHDAGSETGPFDVGPMVWASMISTASTPVTRASTADLGDQREPILYENRNRVAAIK